MHLSGTTIWTNAGLKPGSRQPLLYCSSTIQWYIPFIHLSYSFKEYGQTSSSPYVLIPDINYENAGTSEDTLYILLKNFHMTMIFYLMNSWGQFTFKVWDMRQQC